MFAGFLEGKKLTNLLYKLLFGFIYKDIVKY